MGVVFPWQSLGVAQTSPFMDTLLPVVPGEPEERHYRLRFWDDGKPSGSWSVEKTVTVG